MRFPPVLLALVTCGAFIPSSAWGADELTLGRVLEARCIRCHDHSNREGGLDLKSFVAAGLPNDASDSESFRLSVRIHDRVRDNEMPPNVKLGEQERATVLSSLHKTLVAAEIRTRQESGRSTLRRLNRTEYENTLRDLLGLPALDVRDLLPEDGRVQGYNKGGPALEFSTVQIVKYLEAVRKALPLAIAPYPERDETQTVRIYPGDDGGIMDGIINGCGIPLREFQFDTDLFPLSVPSGNVPAPNGYAYFEQLQRLGKIPYSGSIGGNH
ncbi:MAG: DUF1587 domain-containing protein [Planctomycetota bacterium]|nr:DUF1587 domain-containing protein [Planctomycetota bacterium]